MTHWFATLLDSDYANALQVWIRFAALVFRNGISKL
jgi:hypothetical protein